MGWTLKSKALTGVTDFFEGDQYYDKKLGVTPAIDHSLPTSRASGETEFIYSESSAQPMLSSKDLRNYSPFTMRVMPPLLYLDNPDILTNSEGDRIQLGIYDAAISNNSNFSQFTGAVSQYNNPNSGASKFSQANNPDFATSETMAVGGRSTTKLSPDRQSDQMFESAITDFQVAEEIALQLDAILQAPPITFYINPSSFSISYTKKHQFTERTRYGYIFQAWGEDQPKIAITGRIGSFVAGKGNSKEALPTGHLFASKKDSASFQQLMALLTLYKNNGYIYDLLGNSNAHHLVGCIALEYDHFTYFGHMDSFEWGYEEKDATGGLTYSFNFVVSRMYDNSESSLLVVKPQDSPVVVPNLPMSDSQVPNSITADNRFVNNNVELQNFAQQQATQVGSGGGGNNLKNSQEVAKEVEVGNISTFEEELEQSVGKVPKRLIFNNTSRG